MFGPPSGYRPMLTSEVWGPNVTESAWSPRGSNNPMDAPALLSLMKRLRIRLPTLAAKNSLASVFGARYESLLPDVRHDILQAAIGENPLEIAKPRAVRMRIECMQTLVKDVQFIQTATRPINIVAAAAKKEVEFATENALAAVDIDKLDSASGAALLQAMKVRDGEIHRAAEDERGADVDSLLRGLQTPINDFFGATMVMVAEEDVRYARLSLLKAACDQLLLAGDFTKIVIEG